MSRQNFTKSVFALSFSLIWGSVSFADLPSRPTDANHPSNSQYEWTVRQENLQLNGREVVVFSPQEPLAGKNKFPLVVFGHGQAIGVEGYNLTFQHLAAKGAVVVHPQFDRNFFDQDWRRMAADFNSLGELVAQKYKDIVDSKAVLFAGHSKGAYVALMAAGLRTPSKTFFPSAVLLFAPAGYDSQLIKTIDQKIPVTVVISDSDTVIKSNVFQEIYSLLSVERKQMITVSSYKELKADHFYPLNKSYFFGGQDGASALHYYASWKFLTAAVFDLAQGGPIAQPYLYGDLAPQSGVPGLSFPIQRNW